jgi:outer membrane lipoprotein-sorting protein
MIMPAISRLVAVAVAAALIAACGGPAAPLGPPSARDILSKPNHANLKDAHFLVTGTFSNQGVTVDLKGDGELVYKAPGAGRFTFQTLVAGQTVSFEEISIGGSDYTYTQPGNGKWVSNASASPLGPTSFRGASEFKYVGEENLSAGKAWHAKAKDKDENPFDGWIRESDGYPLKYTLTQQSNALTLTFDKFNTGVTIAAPPPSQVVQG